QKLLATSVERQRADLVRMQAQNADLAKRLKQDPDMEARKRVEDLQHQLSGFDNELRGVQQGLVPPNRMVKVLEEMLDRESRVRLVKLRTLPVSALVEPADKAASTAPGTAKNLVYKHGIEVTVEGNYIDLLEYQSRLEKLPWRMFFARTSVNS